MSTYLLRGHDPPPQTSPVQDGITVRLQRIAYASQSDDLCARMWRRQRKAEEKLGPNWARPKGMHEATRERLLSIIWDCEEQRDGALAEYLAGMMRRYPSLRGDPALR